MGPNKLVFVPGSLFQPSVMLASKTVHTGNPY